MREIASREKSQAPPGWAIWEALADPHRPQGRDWLSLLSNEVEPEVTTAVSPTLVRWTTLWPEHPTLMIQFDIAGGDPSGCSLRWSLWAAEDTPEPATIDAMRHRLNFLIDSSLREALG